MYRRNMLRITLCLAPLLAGLIFVGCAKKQERTRDTDREELKKMLVEMGDATRDHKPQGFDKYIGLSFDAPLFIDTVWAFAEADNITFNPIRFRIWPDEARVVMEIQYAVSDSFVTRTFFGLDAIYENEKWKFTGFDDAGAELNDAMPNYRK